VKQHTRFSGLSAFALLIISVSAASAQNSSPRPFVSPIFGDNMVLQRGKPNTIWGWSEPGDQVRVEIGGNSSLATGGADGKWQAKIQPPGVGGPYTLNIRGKQALELHDVLVGDVWICAGQSNMQFGLSQARNAAEVIKQANYPQMRFFVVGQKAAYARTDTPQGSWKVVSPTTVGGRGGMSAVAFFFGQKLEENLHIPIGLVQEAVGGIPAEAFMSPEGLRPLRDFDAGVAEVERRHREGQPEYGTTSRTGTTITTSGRATAQTGPIPRWTMLRGSPSPFQAASSRTSESAMYPGFAGCAEKSRFPKSCPKEPRGCTSAKWTKWIPPTSMASRWAQVRGWKTRGRILRAPAR
jgi:hypothetical protein